MKKLGDRMKDLVTGVEGIAVGKTEWINGCVRFGLQRLLGKDGKPPEVEWSDTQSLVVTKAAAYYEALKKAAPKSTERRGGPMPDPKF